MFILIFNLCTYLSCMILIAFFSNKMIRPSCSMNVKRAPHSLGKSGVGTLVITVHWYACLRSIAGLLRTLQGMLRVQLHLFLYFFCFLNEPFFCLKKAVCSRSREQCMVVSARLILAAQQVRYVNCTRFPSHWVHPIVSAWISALPEHT